jgi:hypothetical protein
MRKYSGQRTECKNIALVVKNSIKEAMFSPNFMSGIKVYEYIEKSNNKDYLAKRVLRDIFDNLSTRLHSKTFDNTEIWIELIKHGANPVDIIFPLISADSIWYTGLTDFAPHLSTPTSASGLANLPDNVSAMSSGKTCDMLIEKVLSLPTIIYPGEHSADFKNPKARLFSVFLTTSNVFSACAYSPRLTACFEAWVDELKVLDEDYRMRGACYALSQLCAIDGKHQRASVSDEFRQPGLEIMNLVINKLGELRIGADLTVEKDDMALISYARVFDYLGLGAKERVEACVKISKIGNKSITTAMMASLIEAPKAFTSALVRMQADRDLALDVFRMNFRRQSWFKRANFDHIDYTQSFLDGYRAAFLEKGFGDIVGTRAMDPLVINLEMAEHYESLGYLRREGMGELSMFAFVAGGFDKPESLRANPLEEVIKRKVDLAIRLDQRAMLREAAEVYFKGHLKINQDLSCDVAIRHLLERRFFEPTEILTTDRRIEKALALGCRKAVFADKGVKGRWKAVAIEDDLGL